MLRQKTISEKVACTGVGLHSGREIRLEMLPAPADSGISFFRTDVSNHPEIRATVDNVVDTRLATTLGIGTNGSSVTIGTVEHLMAALAGLGIDNIRILVDGPEVPVLDGSSAPFVQMLQHAGIEPQRRSKRFLVIKREVKVEEEGKMARLSPGKGLTIDCSIDFDHPVIPRTPFSFDLSDGAFAREIASARTFGFLDDVQALQDAGLARGGSLDNVIVIDKYRVLNPDGLRYPDEFVRHKILDAIGDLSLFGMPLIGRVFMRRSGHALNTALVKAVLADARNFEIVEPENEEAHRAIHGDSVSLGARAHAVG